MCETTVYLDRDGRLEKLMEDVTRIVVTADGVELTRLLATPLTVQADLHELDALKHTAILRPRPAGPGAPEWILRRRSIRAYTADAVADEQVHVLLQAAMAAPSANDVRPWAFAVVRDAARRRALAETHRWSGMAADAPVVIVVLGDPQASDHWVEDCSAATENLLLAASWLGLGAVWVAVYPRAEREAHVRQALNAPAALRVLCLLPIGHPAEQKPPRTRYEASKVHLETWR